jgi:hypothetical protein
MQVTLTGLGRYQEMKLLQKKNGHLEIYTDQDISRRSILRSEIIIRFTFISVFMVYVIIFVCIAYMKK